MGAIDRMHAAAKCHRHGRVALLLSSRFRQGIAHDGHASLRDLRRTARTPNLWAKDRALKVAQGWTDDLSRRAGQVLRLSG